ncbi:ParA family protein [Nonomuraea sp. NPDC050536]|uniref:ParA family protein n=1 Tax=Nonomuraea sp. NPDC050536 TaxID=3364366 RepID=UPI0037CAE5DF
MAEAIQEHAPNPKTIAVVNQKGGVGKTTTTINLGIVTVAAGGTALVIDADPQRSATDAAALLKKGKHGLPCDFTTESDHQALRNLHRIRNYDRKYVDTPGSLENEGRVQAVLSNSDFVIIPFDLDTGSLKPTIRTADVAREVGVPFAILMTKVDSHPTRGPKLVVEARDAFKELGLPYFNVFTRNYTCYSDCVKNNTIITEWREGSAKTAVEELHRVHGAVELKLSRLPITERVGR